MADVPASQTAYWEILRTAVRMAVDATDEQLEHLGHYKMSETATRISATCVWDYCERETGVNLVHVDNWAYTMYGTTEFAVLAEKLGVQTELFPEEVTR